MSNTPSKAEIEALVKRHGATSYRNRADTQHPAYGFTEDGLNGLIDEVLAKWGTPAQAAEPVAWLDPWTGTKVTTDYDAYGKHGIPLYTAPQPAPTPLSDDVVKDAALWHWLAEYLVGTRTDLDDEIVASKTVNDLRKLVEAAIKQGGKA